VLNKQWTVVFFTDVLFTTELSEGFLLNSCLNLIDSCSESPVSFKELYCNESQINLPLPTG